MRNSNVRNQLMSLCVVITLGFISKSSYPQGANMNIPQDHKSNVIFVKHQSDSSGAWQNKSRVYTSINSAIRAAADGDEIWVAKGCYRENVELIEGINLLGGFEGTETTIEQRDQVWSDIAKTTIDGTHNGRCILAASNTVIDGFKLINGNDAWGAGIGISNSTNIQVRNIMIQSCQVSWAGSGILVDSPRQYGKILIERIVIWQCEAYCGVLEITETTSATVIVRHCTMVQNKGKGLEVPYHDNIVPKNNGHEFYNNIIWDNECPTYPNEQINVWCWARNYSDYNYIAKTPWISESNKWGRSKPHNIFECDAGAPQFVDIENGDFRLLGTSPCIGVGISGADMGAIPYKVPLEPILHTNTAELDFGDSQNSLNLEIKNIGGGTLVWNVADTTCTGWITSIVPSTGILNAGESQNVMINVDRGKVQETAQEKIIDIISSGGNKKITAKISLNQAPQNLNSTIRVNCGESHNFIDNEGKTWEADRAYSEGTWGYIGGNIYSTSDSILNTNNDLLFQTERWGLKAYQFDVENGDYEVNLLFSEIYFNAPELRSFHVEIEGKRELSNYDIFAENGHANSGYKVFYVNVHDSQLNINFIRQIEDPKISAIQVVKKNNIMGMFVSNMATFEQKIVFGPGTFKLLQNYPNPFNSSTTITFEIPDERDVQLIIYNISGQVVCELLNQRLSAGRHHYHWTGTDGSRMPVKSGSYFCRLKTGEFNQSIIMSLVK